MTTVSYPLSNTNFTSAQWRQIFDGDNGIIGCDGGGTTSLNLQLSSTDNTATVGLGKVHYRGFVLEVTAGHALTLAAAVGIPRTYTIGVMYDPAAEGTGPLSLYSAASLNITVPAGGSYMELYQVTRAPSQILSQATRVDLRRYVGPNIMLTANAPLPTDAPLGTRVWDGTNDYVRVRNLSGTGADWSNLTSPTWQAITAVSSGAGATTTSTTLSGTQTPRSRLREGQVILTGTFAKTSGDGFANGSNQLGTLNAAHRPDRTIALSAACEQRNGYNTVRVSIDSAGNVTAFTPSTVADFPHWVCLDGLAFTLKGSDS